MREKEIISRARLGDRAAQGQLIETYYNDVYKFLVRRTGDPFVAQDLTQDTFIKFTHSLPYYRDKGKIKSYIFTIALNCARDYFRAAETTPAADENAYGEEMSAETVFELSQRAERVKNAVDALPETQKDAILLRYYHDMKISEIASVLSVPASTVKTRLHRAKKFLSKTLEGEKNL